MSLSKNKIVWADPILTRINLRVGKLTIIWLLERLLQNFWENKICPAAGESSPALMRSNGNPSLRVSISARRVRSHLLLNFFRRHDAEQQSGFLLICLYDLTAKIRLSAKTLERETIKKASNPELWRSISSSKSDYNILCRPKRTLMQASVRKPTLMQNNRHSFGSKQMCVEHHRWEWNSAQFDFDLTHVIKF